MQIAPIHADHIESLKSWFPDKESSYLWCGPGLRFPYTHQSFLEDMHWQKMPSYSLVDANGALAGFGQYYNKVGRCHLARLAIAPQLRGQGHGIAFFTRLMEIGMQDLSVKECSLFVMKHNTRALRCYAGLGFAVRPYPPDHKHYEDIDFMVRGATDHPATIGNCV